MVLIQGFVCKTESRCMVTVRTDSEQGSVVLVSERDNGQTCQMVSVSLKMEDVLAMRNQLNTVIGEPSKATIVAGIIQLYQHNNFDTDVLDKLMAICGEE